MSFFHITVYDIAFGVIVGLGYFWWNYPRSPPLDDDPRSRGNPVGLDDYTRENTTAALPNTNNTVAPNDSVPVAPPAPNRNVTTRPILMFEEHSNLIEKGTWPYRWRSAQYGNTLCWTCGYSYHGLGVPCHRTHDVDGRPINSETILPWAHPVTK